MTCATEQRLEVRLADPGESVWQRPDAHCECVREGEVVGHCTLWWNRVREWKDHRVGLIGHYSSSDECATALLEFACRQLQEHDCTLAVGPMDGCTWRSYRFITGFGDEPRFFLEPDNPPEWPQHFRDSGFEPLAHYFSALNDQLDCIDPRVQRRSAQLAQAGVTMRPIRREAFDVDMRRIYAVTCQVFRDNLLYGDLDELEFVETYRPLLGQVPLELILLAEHAGRPVGFVFAVPDLHELQRGQTLRTIIVKTLAALPDRQYAGLGQMLLDEVQQRALRMGFSRAIHALVRDVSHLRRISGRYARPIREYTLFAKALMR